MLMLLVEPHVLQIVHIQISAPALMTAQVIQVYMITHYRVKHNF